MKRKDVRCKLFCLHRKDYDKNKGQCSKCLIKSYPRGVHLYERENGNAKED